MCVLVTGKFVGYSHTGDSTMTLAIAKSLIGQPKLLEDIQQFDAKDLANGYTT